MKVNHDTNRVYAVGEADDTAHPAAHALDLCYAEHGPNVCTRYPDHRGNPAAGDSERVVAVWPLS